MKIEFKPFLGWLLFPTWNEPKYIHANIASDLFLVLDTNGLKIETVGNTYQADHAQANGNIAESAIDHVYTRSKNIIEIVKLENSSSDHLPVICVIKNSGEKNIHSRQIMK